MKKFINCIIASLAGLSVLSCQQKEEETVLEPSLKQVTQSVTADPAGGHYEIEYTLTNPVEGVEIQASTEQAEWITAFTYEDGVIGFEVGENPGTSSREGLVTVTYGSYAGFDVPVTQAAAGQEMPDCDVYVECVEFLSSFWGDGYYSNANYYVRMSDLPYDEIGYPDPEGTYFSLDIVGPWPEDMNRIVLPEGTYSFEPYSAEDYQEYTFTMLSDVVSNYKQLTFEDGTITVTHTENGCKIEVSGTLSDGQVYYGVYEDSGVFDDYSVKWLENDVHMDVVDAWATYLDHVAGPEDELNLNVKLIDSPLDGGWITPPGNVMTFVAKVPLNANGDIQPGRWVVSDDLSIETGVLQPGYCVRFGSPFPVGTNVECHDADNNITVGLIVDGYVDVSGLPGDYTLEYNFTTKDGKTVTGIWNGPLEVTDFPIDEDNFHLTEDYNVLLPNGVAADASCFAGDESNSWTIDIRRMNENYRFLGDQLKISLTSSEANAEEGPAPGIYTVGTGVGTVTAGMAEENILVPTYYVTYDGEGNMDRIKGAAAASGELELIKNDDGTYTINFDFMDDQEGPKRFYGSWTGPMDIRVW